MSIQLEVIEGNVLECPADVLALKFAQHLFGVDLTVVERLERKGVQIARQLPAVGRALLVDSDQVVAAAEVLFMGVGPPGRFDYQTIREFARSVLATLSKDRPSLRHLAMTLHGVGFGLDEVEAFRAEVAGVLDAVAGGETPAGLLKVSIGHRGRWPVATGRPARVVGRGKGEPRSRWSRLA